VPRYTGQEARWESFRRWLIMRLKDLKGDDFLILTAPERGYVQFINEGGNVLGECSDPADFSADAQAAVVAKRIVEAGWGPKEEGGSSPNFQVKWFPKYIPVPTPDAPWTPDLDDAVDAADLTVRTLREIFGVVDPRGMEVDGGQSMTVSSLDAELGTLFPGDDD
jgi:hypothetical protein